MIFNPLFIEKSSNSGSVSAAKNPKISGASYLFNDIINVLTNNDELGKSTKTGGAFKAFGQEFAENEGIELNLLQTAEIDLETHKSGDVKKFVKNLLSLLGGSSSEDTDGSDNIVIETNGQKYVVDNNKLNEMLESIIGQIKFAGNNSVKNDSTSAPITTNQLVKILSENKGLVISISDSDKISSFQIVNDTQATSNELFTGNADNKKGNSDFIVKYSESKVTDTDENVVAGLTLAYTGNPITAPVNNIVTTPDKTDESKNNVAFYSYNQNSEQEVNSVNPFLQKNKLANINQLSESKPQTESGINNLEVLTNSKLNTEVADKTKSDVIAEPYVSSKDSLTDDITNQNKSVKKKLNNIGLKLNTIGEQIKETKNISASIDNVAPIKTVETIEPIITKEVQAEKNSVDINVDKVDEKVNNSTTPLNTKNQTETINTVENKGMYTEDSKNIGQPITVSTESNPTVNTNKSNVKDENPILNVNSINVDVNKGNKNEVTTNFSTTLNDVQKNNADYTKQNTVDKPNNINEPLKTEKNNKEGFINKTADILNSNGSTESKEIISDLKNGEVSFKADEKDTTIKQQNVNSSVNIEPSVDEKIINSKTVENNKETSATPKIQNENVELSVKEEVKKNPQTLNLTTETEGNNNTKINNVAEEIVVDKKENYDTTNKSKITSIGNEVVKDTISKDVTQKSVKNENVVDNKIPLQNDNVTDEKLNVNYTEKPNVKTVQNSELPKDINVEKLTNNESVINKENYIPKSGVKNSQPEINISNSEKNPVAGENNVKENFVDNFSKVFSKDESFENITPQIQNEKDVSNLNPQVKNSDTLKTNISPEGNKQVNTQTDVESKQTVVEEPKPETINVKQTNDLPGVVEDNNKTVVIENTKKSDVDIKLTRETYTGTDVKPDEDIKINNTINSSLGTDSKTSKTEIKTDVQYQPKVENNASMPTETKNVTDNSSVPVGKPITTPENSKFPSDSFVNTGDNKKVDSAFTSESNFNKVNDEILKDNKPEQVNSASPQVELKEEPKVNLGNIQTPTNEVEEPVLKGVTSEVPIQKVEVKEEPKVNLGNIQTPTTEVEEPIIKNESTLMSELKSIVSENKSPEVELNVKNNDVKDIREPFKVSTASKNSQSVSINTKIDSLVNKAVDKGVTSFTLHPAYTKTNEQNINVNNRIDNLTENQADYSNIENNDDGFTEPNLNLNSEPKLEKNVIDDKKRTVDINNIQQDKKQTIDENAFARNTNIKNNNETIVGNNTTKAKVKAEKDDSVKAENVVSVKIKRTVKNVVEGTPENRAAEPVKVESEKSTTKTADNTTKTELKTENFAVNSETSKQNNNSSYNSDSREHEESKHAVGMKIGEVENKEKKIFDDILVKQQSNERNVKLTEVIKEVSRYIEKQEKGSLTINIEPENMGKVKISVEVNDKVVRANITVENETVKNMLESKLGDLQSNLNKNGNQNSFVNINLQEQANKNARNNSSRGKNQKDIPVDSIEETDEAKQKSLGYNTYEYLA